MEVLDQQNAPRRTFWTGVMEFFDAVDGFDDERSIDMRVHRLEQEVRALRTAAKSNATP